MSLHQFPTSPTGGTTPSDLDDVRRILPEDGWRVGTVPNEEGDGPWIEATAPGGVVWAIGRDPGGCYFAGPNFGEDGVGLRDLATAEEAAAGMRRFVTAALQR